MEELESLSMKSRKEAFVTGHGGSKHPWEVLWVCSSLLWGCWLFAEWRALHPQSSLGLKLVLEVVVVWLPMILSQTNYLYPFATWIMIGQILVAGILSRRRFTRSTTTTQSATPATNHKLVHLTLYRSSIYFLTFCAILAVDFPLFPRRFCKAEISGYGLMDVGAASFVISSGMVSGKSYLKQHNNTPITFASVIRPLLKAAPLLIIGMIRIVTNQELEYQEHVSEYGVHWNFFFTLGILAIVPTLRKLLLLRLTDNTMQLHMLRRWVLWAPLVAMLLYQYELFVTRNDSHGLEAFILTAPRTPHLDSCHQPDSSVLQSFSCLWMKFFYANREGILGCIGYCFLHAAGEWVGQHYVFCNSGAWSLAKLTMGCWLALFATEGVVRMVSRRETNLPFCLWALAHNLTILLGFQLIAQLFVEVGETTILGPGFDAVNRHGLVSFLVANLLTGLVNLLIPTIDQTDAVAMGIMVVYLVLVGVAALLLDAVFSSSNNSSKRKQTTISKKTN